jgi:hypothetical protein
LKKINLPENVFLIFNLFTIMYLSQLLPVLLATAVTSFALPKQHKHPSSKCLTLSLPQSALPAPNGTVLKYVALALGTQNYTCASPYSTAVPTPNGAKAQLYDAGRFFEIDPAMIPTLPPIALGMYSISYGEISLPDILGFPVLGKHFFNAALQPIFDLYAVNAQLLGKKVGDIPAPAGSSAGLNGTGAVDWLYLVDNSNGNGATFGGINSVYRIETAGGKSPPNCTNSPASFEVLYSSEYWFYGPA